MCILAKTEICYFVHTHIHFIFIIFFHWHNSLQKQSLGIKSSQVCQVDKWSCLRVIIDFVFKQQQLKPGPCLFLYRRHSMRLNNQALPSLLVSPLWHMQVDVNAVQLPLTLVTTQSHTNLLSISPDVLKGNTAQELKHMSMMVS